MALILLLGAQVPSLAAPYGPEGKAAFYSQPDGSKLAVRVYGDEFYAVTKTLDGYPVVRDPKTGFSCYARVSADGTTWESTGIVARSTQDAQGKSVAAAPAGVQNIAKDAQLKTEEILRRVHAAQEKAGVDSRGVPKKIQRGNNGAAGQTSSAISYGPPASPTLGDVTGVVVLVQFADVKGTVPTQEFEALMNQEKGYSGFGNPCSVNEFFSHQSGGKLNFKQKIVEYITLDKPKSYYDNNNIPEDRSIEFLEDIAAKLREKGVDWEAAGISVSGVAQSGSRLIRSFNIYYAGECESDWSTGLWPHSWEPGVFDVGNGYSMGKYQRTDIGAKPHITTFCHENGHMTCDFPDFYSYTTHASIVSNYSLMCANSLELLDGYLKEAAGWGTYLDITATDNKRLAVDLNKNTFIRFCNPERPKEYFLMEWQGETAWGKRISGPGALSEGLIVYHCDEDGSNTYSTINTANPTWGVPYELMIVEAAKQDLTDSPPWFTYHKYADSYKTPGSNVTFRGDARTGAYACPAYPASKTEGYGFKFWTDSGKNGASGFRFKNVSKVGDVVTFEVGEGPLMATPTLGVSTKSLVSQLEVGKTEDQKTFGVYNQGQGTFIYTLSSDRDWLVVDAEQFACGQATNLHAVTVKSEGLAKGHHTARISIASTDQTGGQATQNIDVDVYITASNAELSVSDSTWAMSSAKATKEIIVTTSAENWAASPQEAWITVTPTIAGTGKMTVSVTENTTLDTRSGSVILRAGNSTRTIEILQAGISATLDVPVTNWDITAGAQSRTVNIKANSSWAVSSNATWLSVTPDSGEGNATLTIQVTNNTEVSPRSGTITVSSGKIIETITVNQLGLGKTLSISPSKWAAVQAGGSQEVGVNANVAWTVTSDSDWLTMSSNEGTGNGSVTVTAQANPAAEPRTGIVTFSSSETAITGTFTVTQRGVPHELTVAPSAWHALSFAAASTTIEVSSNTSWTASSGASDWLTVSPSSGNKNGSLTLNVTPNNNVITRSGIITVTTGETTQQILVSQVGIPAQLTVSETSWSPKAEAGTTRVNILCNTVWRASSSAAWLTLSAVNGSGNGALTLKVAANTGSQQRSGFVTVTAAGMSQTIKVTQEGVPPLLTLSDYAWNSTGRAQNKAVRVTSNTSWKVSSSAPSWLTTSPSSGTKDQVIIISASANTTATARAGIVTVSTVEGLSKSITVTQEAPSNILNISASLWTPTAASGSNSIGITSNAAWSASSSAPWLTLDSASGIGNGSLTLRVTANDTAEPRRAFVKVTAEKITRTISVMQAGSGSGAGLALSATRWDAVGQEESKVITLTSGLPWAAISDSPTWLIVSPEEGKGDSSLTLTVKANDTAEARTGNILVMAGDETLTIVVKQISTQQHHVITQLMLFDKDAKLWVDKNGGMEPFALAMIAKANLALLNSGANFSFRLVHTQVLNKEWSIGNKTYFDFLLDIKGNEEALALREQYKADLVTVFTGTAMTEESPYGSKEKISVSGCAEELDNPERLIEGGDPDGYYASHYQHTICYAPTAATSFVLSHLWGHNLGAGHARNQEYGSDETAQDKCGYYFRTRTGARLATIMAYITDKDKVRWEQALLYSNINGLYRGEMPGVKDEANNTRTMDLVAPRVSLYQDDATPLSAPAPIAESSDLEKKQNEETPSKVE